MMLTRRRSVSSSVTMSVRKNKQIERVKMSDIKNKYVAVQTGNIFNLVYKGDVLCVVTDKNGREVVIDTDSFHAHFAPYTKEMAKQAKYSEDLGTLASVTSEIRKLLDNGHVICHAKANSDIEGLVEYTVMLGESK